MRKIALLVVCLCACLFGPVCFAGDLAPDIGTQYIMSTNNAACTTITAAIVEDNETIIFSDAATDSCDRNQVAIMNTAKVLTQPLGGGLKMPMLIVADHRDVDGNALAAIGGKTSPCMIAFLSIAAAA